MNLLSKLGLVYDDSEKEKEVKTESEKTEKVISTSISSNTSALKQSEFIPSSSGSFDQSVFDKLSKSIEDNNLKGNDFLEFLKALNGLSSVQIEENAKFLTVFATLSSSSEGISKEQLLSSAKHYIDVLEAEKVLFVHEMNVVIEEKVNNNIKNIANNEKLIKSKLEDIEKLKNEIENFKINNQKLLIEVDKIKSKVESKKADFDFTFKSLLSQIISYKEKIEKYIN